MGAEPPCRPGPKRPSKPAWPELRRLAHHRFDRLIRDPAAAQSAIAVRVLGEVLLVIFLGVIKLGRVTDLRRDGGAVRLRQRLLVLALAGLGGLLLRRRGRVDSRA